MHEVDSSEPIGDMLRVLSLALLFVAVQAVSLSQLKSIKLKPVVNGAVNAVIPTEAGELLKKSSFPQLSKSDPTVIFAVRRPG